MSNMRIIIAYIVRYAIPTNWKKIPFMKTKRKNINHELGLFQEKDTTNLSENINKRGANVSLKRTGNRNH